SRSRWRNSANSRPNPRHDDTIPDGSRLFPSNGQTGSNPITGKARPGRRLDGLRNPAFTLKTPVPRSVVGEESELRLRSTHSLINSSPQHLSACHFLAFTRPDHVYHAAQYQLGVKASDVCGLPPLASDWPFKITELDGQGVVQREKAEDRIFEHNFVARCAPARPNYQPDCQVGNL